MKHQTFCQHKGRIFLSSKDIFFHRKEFKLRQEFYESAQTTLAAIGQKYQSVLRKRLEAKGKKWKRKKKLTFVGIHSRRGDYLALQEEHGKPELTPNYFLDAMEMYR